MQEKGTEPSYARERNRAKLCKNKEQSQGMQEKGTSCKKAAVSGMPGKGRVI